jgi:hypothetical protein
VLVDGNEHGFEITLDPPHEATCFDELCRVTFKFDAGSGNNYFSLRTFSHLSLASAMLRIDTRITLRGVVLRQSTSPGERFFMAKNSQLPLKESPY